MIAAVKYNKAERELKLVRPFGVGAQSMLFSGWVYAVIFPLVPLIYCLFNCSIIIN